MGNNPTVNPPVLPRAGSAGLTCSSTPAGTLAHTVALPPFVAVPLPMPFAPKDQSRRFARERPPRPPPGRPPACRTLARDPFVPPSSHPPSPIGANLTKNSTRSRSQLRRKPSETPSKLALMGRMGCSVRFPDGRNSRKNAVGAANPHFFTAAAGGRNRRIPRALARNRAHNRNGRARARARS